MRAISRKIAANFCHLYTSDN
ncbi:hypothetical protein STPYR_10915 [uncultured Stenotrophomonas sp.]|uniref:Uncharacterized protein n=1 Tax=uncultured Stenotrophomonas sp. TaxID=165438 RepID=A0A1Y5Q5D5_9GAMM|nr:hypothetical protein STPYR_10915 [uncultured Stenotrophomonas sp.]